MCSNPITFALISLKPLIENKGPRLRNRRQKAYLHEDGQIAIENLRCIFVVNIQLQPS